jgi:hypothetical protein
VSDQYWLIGTDGRGRVKVVKGKTRSNERFNALLLGNERNRYESVKIAHSGTLVECLIQYQLSLPQRNSSNSHLRATKDAIARKSRDGEWRRPRFKKNLWVLILGSLLESRPRNAGAKKKGSQQGMLYRRWPLPSCRNKQLDSDASHTSLPYCL